VVLEHSNKQGMNEAMGRMKELMDYKSDVNKTDRQTRLNENSEVDKTINRMRELFNN
jgi:hypothetical protein